MSLAEGVRMALRTELNPNWDRELIRLPAGDAPPGRSCASRMAHDSRVRRR